MYQSCFILLYTYVDDIILYNVSDLTNTILYVDETSILVNGETIKH